MNKLYYLLFEEEKEETPTDEQKTDKDGGNDFDFLNDENLEKASENMEKLPDVNPLEDEDDFEVEKKSENNADENVEKDENSIYKNKDEEKVKKLFTDTGDPKIDYSLNADANKRLAKFKFKYAGIDINSLLTDQEKKTGIRVDQLLSRLSPEQYEMYIQKSKELRREFPLIAERERKIIIYNCNIPFFYRDKEGKTKIIKHKKDLANAIDKVDKFMIKSFGQDWVDDKYAIEFLQNIQIDFSSDKKIKSNLLSVSIFTEKNFSLFNKIYIEMPDSVRNFINKNLENKQFEKSNLFKVFVSDFEQLKNSSKISVFPLIKTEENQESSSDSGEAETGEAGETEESPEETGEAGGETNLETGTDLTGGEGEETPPM